MKNTTHHRPPQGSTTALPLARALDAYRFLHVKHQPINSHRGTGIMVVPGGDMKAYLERPMIAQLGSRQEWHESTRNGGTQNETRHEEWGGGVFMVD